MVLNFANFRLWNETNLFFRQLDTKGERALYEFSTDNNKNDERWTDWGWMEKDRMEIYGHDSQHKVCYQQFNYIFLFFLFLIFDIFLFFYSDLILMVWKRLLSWIAKSMDLWTSLGAGISLLVPLEPQWLDNVC